MRSHPIPFLTTLAATMLLAFSFTAIAIAAQPVTTRVSVDSGGNEGDRNSSHYHLPVISGDGRYVAFDSEATNLVTGDANNTADIFVHDRQTGQTARVSLDTDSHDPDWFSYAPAISGDGRYVAFRSGATDLVAGDTNNNTDTFVRDRTLNQTTRVSVASNGIQANGGSYDNCAISPDGRYVAFVSSANNLVPLDFNNVWDVFVHDLQAGTTELASVNSSGIPGNGHSLHPSFSGDGRYVAFFSAADNLSTAADTNARLDVFVHDRQSGETTLISADLSGKTGNSDSVLPSISADGRYVAFVSDSSNLVMNDANNHSDVFVRDRNAGQTTRVSVDSSGNELNVQLVSGASISADGRYVAFSALGMDLVLDAYVHDQQTGKTTLVSVDPDGNEGNVDSGSIAISADGRFVTFTSLATNLVPNDTNNALDVFVRGPLTGFPWAMFLPAISGNR